MSSIPEVSVVVPVHNSERYLRDAVGGILGERDVDLELVLVDDGSTDGSGKIVDELAASDPRVVAVHKENGGICSARNAGLDIVRGEYVTFCDDDDLVLPGFVADNLKVARESGADCVRFGIRYEMVDNVGSTKRWRRYLLVRE